MLAIWGSSIQEFGIHDCNRVAILKRKSENGGLNRSEAALKSLSWHEHAAFLAVNSDNNRTFSKKNFGDFLALLIAFKPDFMIYFSSEQRLKYD